MYHRTVDPPPPAVSTLPFRRRRRSLPPFLFAALAVLLGACDRSGPVAVEQPLTEKAISSETASDAWLDVAAGDVTFGCTGEIWSPKKGAYRPIDLKVNVPKTIVDAADGATYTPRFKLHDEEDPEDRLLMNVVCTLPDVDDPKVEKAHAHVAKKLAKDVRKLQREMEAAAAIVPLNAWETTPAVDMARDYLNGAPQFGDPLISPGNLGVSTSSSCTPVLVRVYYWNGVRVEVYDCGGGDGGGDDGGGGSGGDDPPSDCAPMDPNPECQGGGGEGVTVGDTNFDCHSLGSTVCDLHDAVPEEVRKVQGAINRIRTDDPTCARFRTTAQAMLGRGLQVWENEIIDARGGRVLGDADWRTGAPRFHLWFRVLSDPEVVVHEAMHGTYWNDADRIRQVPMQHPSVGGRNYGGRLYEDRIRAGGWEKFCT